MDREPPRERIYSPDYIENNFDSLRDAALQNLTSYVCGWSMYTMEFLNAVAVLQGSKRRLDLDAVVALRKGPKRIRDPRLATLIRESRSARTMKIDEIIELIESKVEERSRSVN